jgi:hypothetical protein
MHGWPHDFFMILSHGPSSCCHKHSTSRVEKMALLKFGLRNYKLGGGGGRSVVEALCYNLEGRGLDS